MKYNGRISLTFQDNTGLMNDRMAPIQVGIVGTGYVAKTRAEILKQDQRTQVRGIVGHLPEKTMELGQILQIPIMDSWQELVSHEQIDLVIISGVNRDHAEIARQSLANGKHVVVEYPLAFSYAEGKEILDLAKRQNKLIHVEHIELLGGLHNSIKSVLPLIGQVFYARYVTINPQQSVSRKWTYSPQLFGFPLIGALSRLHRLVDLLGEVDQVYGQAQFWSVDQDYYRACLTTAQLHFAQGAIAETIYGKGEVFSRAENNFTIYGEKGTLIFGTDKGQLIQGERIEEIEVPARKGLFAKDTKMVIDHLLDGVPLYIQPTATLYTLQVAEAIQKSAELQQVVKLLS